MLARPLQLALLLLGAAAPAAAFLDRDRGLHLFALPEARSALHHAATALHGNSRWRLLQQREGGYPEVHDAHEFVGTTKLGFISFNVRALAANHGLLSQPCFSRFDSYPKTPFPLFLRRSLPL